MHSLQTMYTHIHAFVHTLLFLVRFVLCCVLPHPTSGFLSAPPPLVFFCLCVFAPPPPRSLCAVRCCMCVRVLCRVLWRVAFGIASGGAVLAGVVSCVAAVAHVVLFMGCWFVVLVPPPTVGRCPWCCVGPMCCSVVLCFLVRRVLLLFAFNACIGCSSRRGLYGEQQSSKTLISCNRLKIKYGKQRSSTHLSPPSFVSCTLTPDYVKQTISLVLNRVMHVTPTPTPTSQLKITRITTRQ